jgi:hypothetical protein
LDAGATAVALLHDQPNRLRTPQRRANTKFIMRFPFDGHVSGREMNMTGAVEAGAKGTKARRDDDQRM